MKNNVNDLFIQEMYKKYQAKYNLSLPSIDKICYVKDVDFWARFNSDDLYNKKYVLYVDANLLDQNKKFIKQILFHEFTHLSDSLDYLSYSIDDFKRIMTSYSEFNASKREMVERLEEVSDESISLQTEITHAGILTINSFMKQSYEFMIKDLKKMYDNNDLHDFFYDTSHIYYFYGYLSALHQFGIEYFYAPASEFLLITMNIEKTLIQSESIDVEKVLSTYKDMEKAVKDQYKFNRIRRVLP